MKIFTPKLIKKIFATMIASSLVAGVTLTAQAVGEGVTILSRGRISYNADSTGDPEVYFESDDLTNLNQSLQVVDSSMNALANRVNAAEADVTAIKNTLGSSSGTELTTVMQNLLTSLNTKTGQNAATLQAAVNGMASLGSDVTYPETLPAGRSATDTGIRLNGYYNNKNLNVLMGGSYGINATTAASNEVEGKHTTSTSPYTQTTTDENASVLSITPQAGYYNGSTPIYVDLTNINTAHYESGYNRGYGVGYDVGYLEHQASQLAGTISYTLVHQHVGNASEGGACYEDHPETVSGTHYTEIWIEDPNYPGSGRMTTAYVDPQPYSYVVHHWVLNCGHEEGDVMRVTTDFDSIQPDEKISEARITFD